MDRVTYYTGQILRTNDLLQSQQFAMTALAKLAEATLGTNTIVDGLACTPTTPATLNVLVGAGQIFELENLEATAWSGLSADLSHSIVKQGIMLDAVELGITPPATAGYSQVYLVQAQYADEDTGATVLPYYNASNPSSPYSGPGNSGNAENTQRKGVVSLQLKAGTAAATGSQVAPTADAGWTGLYTVTVANGATSISSGNIATLDTAPFIPAKLPAIPAGVQNGTWIFGQDTGTANNIAVSFTPPITSLTKGMMLEVETAFACTGPVNVAVDKNTPVALVREDGTPLQSGDYGAAQNILMSCTGSAFQMIGRAGAAVAYTPGGSWPTTWDAANRTIFDFTGADQDYTIPAGASYLRIFVWAASGGGSLGGYAEGIFAATGVLAPSSALKIMVGQFPSPTFRSTSGGVTSAPSSVYGFGGIDTGAGPSWSSNYSSYNAGGLSGVFSGSGAILATDASRAIVVAGGGAGQTNYGPNSSTLGGYNGGDPTYDGGESTFQGGAASGGAGPGGGGYYGGVNSTERANGGSSFVSSLAAYNLLEFINSLTQTSGSAAAAGNPDRGTAGQTQQHGRVVIYWA